MEKKQLEPEIKYFGLKKSLYDAVSSAEVGSPVGYTLKGKGRVHLGTILEKTDLDFTVGFFPYAYGDEEKLLREFKAVESRSPREERLFREHDCFITQVIEKCPYYSLYDFAVIPEVKRPRNK